MVRVNTVEYTFAEYTKRTWSKLKGNGRRRDLLFTSTHPRTRRNVTGFTFSGFETGMPKDIVVRVPVKIRWPDAILFPSTTITLDKRGVWRHWWRRPEPSSVPGNFSALEQLTTLSPAKQSDTNLTTTSPAANYCAWWRHTDTEITARYSNTFHCTCVNFSRTLVRKNHTHNKKWSGDVTRLTPFL